ncbi:hypothetical protein OC842_000904 [Tilletia horrida]|uniref:BRCT domain-containing protein n=1 Tax=Tilletia horrida TaxID=155126 RepID=A0AAN6GIL5_9BASI|nr:hypothetical protein OC842_000904 [Tilletia horrida]
MPESGGGPPASQPQPYSRSWRQAAYASQAGGKSASASSSTTPISSSSNASTSKTKSSTSQKVTQAKDWLTANASSSSSKTKSSGSSVSLSRAGGKQGEAGFRSGSSSGGLAGLPLYSNKATDEVRALTSKKGMQSKDNPITHSRMAERTQHYVSSATGHQVANRMIASFPVADWRDVRQSKLREQAVEKSNSMFAGVTAYLNGYQGEEKINLDITRKIQENGGKVNYLYSKSQCTHIISSRALSGKKNQEWLVDKRKNIVKLVRPEWVYESIAAGRRLAESKYPVFSDQTQGSILSAFSRKDGEGSSSTAQDAAPDEDPPISGPS